MSKKYRIEELEKELICLETLIKISYKAHQELQSHINLKMEELDNNFNTKIHALIIARNRPFKCINDDSFIFPRPFYSFQGKEGDDYTLEGIAHPLKWEVWVKKNEPK